MCSLPHSYVLLILTNGFFAEAEPAVIKVSLTTMH